MKRDMDLVRTILLAVEAQSTTPIEWIEHFSVEGHEQDATAYHVWLLAQAGLLLAQDNSDDDEFACHPRCLTWAGCEYLDAVRDPEIWAKTKQGAQKVGSFGIQLIAALAKGFIKEKAKQHTGVDLQF